METWCFTFGLSSPLKRYYVQIDAKDQNQARLRMFALFTRHWAFCYPLAEFQEQIDKYGYSRLNIYTDASIRLGTIQDEIEPAMFQQIWPWEQTT